MNDSTPSKPRRRWYQFYPLSLLIALFVALLINVFFWLGGKQDAAQTTTVGCVILVSWFLILVSWFLLGLLRAVLPALPRRLFQFSLRTLLLVMLVFGCGFGWLAMKMERARRQREAVAAIEKADGYVAYDYELNETGSWINGAKPPAPAWARKLLGGEFFADVVLVTVGGPNFDNNDMTHLKGLSRLRWLRLGGTQVTDAGLVHLKGLTNLDNLSLDNTQVTDAGLEHLKGLTNLEWLVLHNTQVTDAGLEHLQGLTNLKWLRLEDTQVTDEGVAKLQQALPNCKIYH